MGRKECCSKVGLNRGSWTTQEDNILTSYINAHGEGKWRYLPERAGLKRCGKSCRLRWLNYLKPDIKRGDFTPDEDDLILRLHRLLGNRWSLIAGRLPGRTDNEIKNYWHTKLAKKAYPSSPQPNYNDPANTKTKALKPVPFKATRPVNCPEFPFMNSNPPSLRENLDLHHNEVNPVNFDDFDLGLCDFENNNGDNHFPASNCLSSMEAFLMEDEHNKNYLDMEGVDMFVNTDQRP